MSLVIRRQTRASFDTKLSAIPIFRRIHFGRTAKVNSAEAIVEKRTIVPATSAEFTWALVKPNDALCRPRLFDSFTTLQI